MVSLHSIQNNDFEKKATFKIMLDADKSIFMSISKSAHEDKDRYVVIVNSEKFLTLWKKEPNSIHVEESMGNPKTWMADNKMGPIAKRFSQGINNPHSLADISCIGDVRTTLITRRKYLIFNEFVKIEENKFDYVCIGDGITRTLWLLAHKFKYFPVECRLVSAAGATRDSMISVEDLFQSGWKELKI